MTLKTMCRLRDEVEDMMQKDLSMKLVIAIETALADNRYEVWFLNFG